MVCNYYLNISGKVSLLTTSKNAILINQHYVDFSNMNLSNQYFCRSQFVNACFDYAHLEHAFFDHCRFINDTSFNHAKLQNAIFHACDFIDTSFEDADLSQVIFEPSYMVNFWHCNFNESNCSRTNFNGYGFSDHSSFVKANFTDADLKKSIFQNCDLTDAIFSNSCCQNLHFIHCILPPKKDFNTAKGLEQSTTECPPKAFLAWKKVLVKINGKNRPALMELKVPKEAKRIIERGKKHQGRCNVAQIGQFYLYNSQYELEKTICSEAIDIRKRDIIYKEKQILSNQIFDENPLNERGNGISFYLTPEEAIISGTLWID